MAGSLADLGRAVKARYPGSYDDMDDASLAKAVKAKYPGAYDDFSDAPAAPPVSKGESAVLGALQGLSQGFGEEIAAGGRAYGFGIPGAEMLAEPDSGPEKYRSAVKEGRALNEAARAANPGTYLAGQVAGAVAPAAILPASGMRGLVATAGQGTLEGAGYSDADSLRGLAGDTALGGAFGTAGFGLGAALSRAGGKMVGAARDMAAKRAATEAASESTVAIKPGRSATEKIFGEPEMIPEARYLAERGVRLTKGMYDPKSNRALVEMASTSFPGAGAGVMKQRSQALEDAIALGFREGAPPGWTGKLTGDINEKYSILKAAWDDAYDQIRATGEKIYPAIHDGSGGVPLRSAGKTEGALDRIVNDLDETWDDANRAVAKRFLDNQIGRITEGKGALARVDIGDMLKVLSEIKRNGRSAARKQNYDLAEIMSRAQDAVEQALESQASPETSAALRSLNAKYRDFKVIEDAVVRAGDSPAGITPSRYSAAVKAAEPYRARYAAGGGGPHRELSRAINVVFDESASPKNGARLFQALPGVLKSSVVAPTIYLRNAAGVRTAAPGHSATLADAIRRLGERGQQASMLAPAYGLGVVPLAVRPQEE